MNPIIDPATLTEEQREDIRAEYKFNARCFARFSLSSGAKCQNIGQWHKGRCDMLELLFGENFFKKGE